MEKTSRRSILGRHQSCYKERIEVSIRRDRTLSFFMKHVQKILYSKSQDGNCAEVIYEKVYMSPRPPPKISLRHDWKRELGSEHAQRPEGQVVKRSRSFQSNQPIPNLTDRGNPLSELTREPCKMEEKRPVPRRSM